MVLESCLGWCARGTRTASSCASARDLVAVEGQVFVRCCADEAAGDAVGYAQTCHERDMSVCKRGSVVWWKLNIPTDTTATRYGSVFSTAMMEEETRLLV